MHGFHYIEQHRMPELKNEVFSWLVDCLAEREGFSSAMVGQVFWFDTAHVYNPMLVRRAAAAYPWPAERVMRLIHVEQPFTAHQLRRRLSRIPTGKRTFSYHTVPSVHHPLPSLYEGGGRPAALHHTSGVINVVPVVVVSGLEAMLNQASLHDVVWDLSQLSQRAFVLVLPDEQADAAQSHHFYGLLRRWATPWTPPVSSMPYLEVVNA